ncbi:MAG: hypothetical protein HQ565_10195 [Bacteroidetes bacterium]|nr:hypothetical protein [Bacteroidota bacterium]
MKTKMLLLLLIGLLVVSCKKENDNSELMIQEENVAVTKAADMRTLYYYWAGCPLNCTLVVIRCWWPAHNCLPTVVVTANTDNLSLFEDFVDAYDYDEIETFFSDTSNVALFPGITELDSVLTDLQNGDITLYKKIGEDTLDYYIGINSIADMDEDYEDDLRVVFPVDVDK